MRAAPDFGPKFGHLQVAACVCLASNLLVATACSRPPAGRARWTLELLAGELVSLTEHASVSRETVRRRLAENHLKPWRKEMWCIPQVDAEYVGRMEDVLDLYAETHDPKRPVVCFDESRSGSSVRCDSRSQPSRARSSVTTASTSAMEQPTCSSSSTSIGRGARSRSLRAGLWSTSQPACATLLTSTSQMLSGSASSSTICRPTRQAPLYQTFPADEARRVLRRLEFHYVPKHASWLNMVEIEIGVLAGQWASIAGSRASSS
jgi:hypothetical protein